MKGVLLAIVFVLCLLTHENRMMAKAGSVTKIRKRKTWYDKYSWCCIKKGCQVSVRMYTKIHCLLVIRDQQIKCKCVKWTV